MPELHPYDINLDEYDMLVIGSPVWATTYAPAVNTFFTQNEIKGKKVALFCCHAGGMGKFFQKTKDRLEGNEFLGEIDFKDPLKGDKDKEVQKAKEWASQL